MSTAIECEDFLNKGGYYRIIDVRTPAEFARAHIPGAVNIPLFTNEERAEIGTAYTQEGRREAMMIGLDRVGPRLRSMMESIEPLLVDDTVLIHCWRGGMRSGSVAWLVEYFGHRVFTLRGGYKSFRRYVLNTFEQERRLLILGGRTGSGKTELLHAMEQRDEQVIDLEGLAHHRGSAFGALGLESQPGQEQFENDLALHLRKRDCGRTLWLEDESRLIGRLEIPLPLYHRMRRSPVIFLDIPRGERIEKLVAEYGTQDREGIRSALENIKKRLGGLNARRACEALDENQPDVVCDIVLDYYDKAYGYGISQRVPETVFSLTPSSTDTDSLLEEIQNLSRQIMNGAGRNGVKAAGAEKTLPELSPIALTSYSHGSGCGCKLSPAVLEKILDLVPPAPPDPRLLVGYDRRDDAAVYDLENGQALIHTTDFFMPIVDDPFDFGRIAAVNALSDVYAMGGNPLLALSLLGWPLDKIAAEVAGRVLEGARSVCDEAGAALAGGHSIDSPEPIFGLAVTGVVGTENIKRNDGARSGDILYLTKALGVGILTTATKKKLLRGEDEGRAIASMVRLNRLGAKLGGMEMVHAMTDVTGFGLLGHLTEMCRASEVNALLDFDRIRFLTDLSYYLERGAVPGGAGRNWESYGRFIGPLSEERRNLLSDPQTSGGLLIALDPDGRGEFEDLLEREGLGDFAEPIGGMSSRREGEPFIYVR